MKAKIFRYSNPHPVIKEFREIKADDHDKILTHFVPPMGCPEIVFYIGARSQIKNTVVKDGFIKGQYNTLQSIEFHPGYHLFGVVLQPYGLKQLFNIRANELLNAVIDVKEHPLTASLAEWLNGVTTINPAVVEHVSATLQTYPLQPVSHSTLTFIELISNTSENKIGSILKNTGIELRTLQRKFKAEVGLTPKEFIRIVRMKRLEADISSGKNLLQIVADFDFTDQSHLIKEFKDLRSFTPGELISRKLLLSDQLPVPDYFSL